MSSDFKIDENGDVWVKVATKTEDQCPPLQAMITAEYRTTRAPGGRWKSHGNVVQLPRNVALNINRIPEAEMLFSVTVMETQPTITVGGRVWLPTETDGLEPGSQP